MDYEELLLKTSTIMKSKEFSIQRQKICLDIIIKYLKSLEFKSTIVGKTSINEYLLRLKELNRSSDLINVYEQCLNFFLDEVLTLKVEENSGNLVEKKEKIGVNDENINFNIKEIVKISSEVDEDISDKKIEVENKSGIEDFKENKTNINNRKLPLILSVKEVSNILECIKNPNHNIMISFLYSTGVRLSELINIKRADIDFDNKIIVVRSLKGKKQRETLLSSKLKYILLDYMSNNKFNTDYLFETNRLKKYTKAGVQKVIRENSRFLNMSVSPNTFRHSFAVHLLEAGINVKFIQKLLGHSKLDTTMIYTRVADIKLKNIVNPYDLI